METEKKIRLLIVEDESIVAADIEDGLTSAGYEVVGIASSGFDAIILAEQHRPDLILMDIRLQGKMTGIEAAQRIEMQFQIPIIYLTAHSDEVTLEQAKLTKPFGYLLKPFGQRELRATIEIALYRANIEKKLSESEHWNRTVIETAHNAFVAMDQNGLVTDWNPAAEEMFGWKSSEAIGRPLAEMVIPEAFRQAHYRGLERYLKTGIGPVLGKLIELRAKHHDGHEFPVELTIAAAQVQGEPRFLSFVQDISERKHLELEKRRREEVERSNAELERFAHVTSHDLQEPLRTISMYTELLRQKLADQIGEEEKVFMEHLVRGASKMRQLIDDLLSYSRVGTTPESVSKFNVTDTLKSALENLEGTISQTHAKVIYHGLPEVKGHANQIRLLFENLISNAIKFRKDEPPVIRISSQRDGDFWCVAVADNGIGFDEKYGELIFDMFKRLHGLDEYPGTGMGLAICKKIVALNGGRIWVKSSPGAGATFYFTLPATDPYEGSLNGMRILLVDDSAQASTTFFHLLQGTGANIEWARSGVEAVEKAGKDHYDLILMDIFMPGLDGVAATDAIREQRLQTPIIGFTGHEIESVRKLAPRGTFDDYWPKSLPPESLVSQLSRWYRSARQAS